MGLFDNIRDAWRTAEDLVFDTEREKERRRAAESLARTNQQISQGQGFKYGVLANPQARQNFVANNQAPQFSYSTALKQAAHSALTDPSQYADSLINVGNFKGSGIIEDFLNSPMNTAQGIATVGSGHVKEGLGKIGTSLLEGPLGFVPLGRATEVGLKAAPAITSIAKAGLKQGAKEGAVFGGIYGAADAAEQNKSPLEIAKSTGIGTLLGGGGGAVLGGTMPLAVKGGKELFNLGLKGAEKGTEWTARQLDNFLEDEVRPTVIEHPEPPPPPPTNNNPTPPPQTAPEVVNRQGADSIAEVIRERQQPNNLGRSVVDELAARYGGTPNAINQNIDRFGLDLTNNMYARKSDSPLFNPETGTGIKDIDAVVTSELAKQNPNAPRVMSPEEMASLEATAPPPTVDEVARVQGITRPEAEQRIADLSTPDNAPNKLLQEASAEVNPAIPNKPTISQRVENVLNNPPANLRRMESNYDIENEDPLAQHKQEALKYKSAEEFVKAQGEPAYHRSQNKFDKFDISKASNDSNRQRVGWGLYFSDTVPHNQYGNYLYEAQIPKGTLLDTKKPVDEKIVSKIVEAVKGNGKNPSELVEFSNNGYLFYKTLSRILGGDKEASLFLSKNGVDGIKSNIGKYSNDYILFDDKSIKTKRQLTDIYNQAHSSGKAMSIDDPTAALKQEALKYKSADEFVKAQGEPLYHGTKSGNRFDQFDLNKDATGVGGGGFGNGFNQGKAAYLTPSKEAAGRFSSTANEVATLKDVTLDPATRNLRASSSKTGEVLEFNLNKGAKIASLDHAPTKTEVDVLKNKGYDGARFDDKNAWAGYSEGRFVPPKDTTSLAVWNKDALISKQELTDLYNQAHAEAKTGQEASKYKIFQEIEEDWRKEDIARMNELELKIKNSVNTASGLPVELLKEYYSLLNKYGKKEAVTPPDQTHAGVKTPKATTDETPYFAAQRKNAEKQANEAVDNLISEVEARGHRVDDILRKMQEANRGLRQLTPEELESANLITNRMNQAREKYYASIGQPVPETNQPFYAPQAKKGTVKLPQTREEMYDLKYENPRLNKIDLDEMDYNKDPLVDYIMRAENRDLLRKSAIEKAAIKDKRVITPEQIERVAQKTNELFDKLAPENGSGKAVKNDTSGDFYNIGKDEGYKQGTNDYKPSILDQTPLNIFKKAGIYDRGIEQYHNAEGYATHFVEKMSKEKVSPSDIGKQLYRELRRIAPKSDKSSTSSIVERTMIAIENRGIETSAEALPFIQNAMRQAAKADLIKYAKTTNITDKKLRAVFNETLNNIIARDAYGQSFGKNLDKFLSERLNVSLRGANILSAAFELGDFANIGSNYGAKFLAKAQKGALGLQFSKRYGLADTHYMSADIPEVSKMNQIFSNPNWNMPRKIYEAYRTVENKLLVFKYVEQHKTEVFLRASEAHYKAEGLTGKALVDRVMDDYYKTMLPRTILTANRLIGKLPNTLTQYLDWSIQATNRLGRTISGSNEAGRFANQSRIKRVARGTTTELIPKVVAAGIVGVPIMQILGMRDFTGATQGDFTGISDEDKTKLDTFMSYVSLSPILSLGTNAYFADRRNDIAARNKAQGKTYGITPRPEDTTKGVAKSTLETFVPFHSQIKKSADAISAYKKGYYENKQGRVQALADNKSELPLGVVFGKSMTPSFREYQDNPDLAQVLKGKAKPQDLLTKNQSVANVAQTFNLPSPRNYNRPLTDDYTTAFKDNPKNLRNEILTNGRDYNRKLDDLKRSDPTRYANYIQSLDGNHVNPEFWRQVMGGNASEGDLTVFKMMQSRKKQLYADMTKYGNNKDHKFDYDPIYNLNDEQARQVLQMKSTATGEDLALSNILYKEDWFKKYKDAETKFYNTRPASDKDFFQTARLKDWSKLNDQYSGLRGFGKDAGLINKYPLVVQQKAINDKYGYGSQQSKDWFKANADAYKAQKDQYDGAVLAVINKMRKIEGVGPMSAEAYAQATNIENTDDKKKKTYASSSGRGSKSSPRFSSSDSAIDDIIREVAGLQSKDFDKFRRPTLKTVSKPTTKKISPPKMNKKLTVKKTMRRA